MSGLLLTSQELSPATARRLQEWALLASVRPAARGLVRRPGYSLTVIATLALGIGSATGIFTVVDALLVRPIPFEDPDRLVTISRSGRSPLPPDPEALREWRAQDRIFSDVRAHQPRSFLLTGAGDARSEMARLVEPGFLEMLGVRPVLGRSFTEADDLLARDAEHRCDVAEMFVRRALLVVAELLDDQFLGR